MPRLRIIVCVLVLGITGGLISGCAGVVVAGGAAAASIAHDRRTAGTVIDDNSIEIKADDAFARDKELHELAHISATAYNGIVLLTGEAPSEALRARAEALVAKIGKVRKVYNEVIIAAPSSTMSRSSDALVTGNLKAAMLTREDTDPTRTKVVTSNGTVYLMGLVTHAEAELAVDAARRASGVQRVVKLFEYID
jgi:osmotically-inducible protein OsmY